MIIGVAITIVIVGVITGHLGCGCMAKEAQEFGMGLMLAIPAFVSASAAIILIGLALADMPIGALTPTEDLVLSGVSLAMVIGFTCFSYLWQRRGI